ncbi:unnamed protein product [Spirodela intermedia]|uniref:Uncharacterized protein n=1 Tax=Spirodela intermedia TaxID=51605 RepID=A0A7I8JQY9_SPIIN|nr:unnamed protein product [Spirodela intermedia]CAA6672570.1 unnamed protein product [Spirodela intermedia]
MATLTGWPATAFLRDCSSFTGTSSVAVNKLLLREGDQVTCHDLVHTLHRCDGGERPAARRLWTRTGT